MRRGRNSGPVLTMNAPVNPSLDNGVTSAPAPLLSPVERGLLLRAAIITAIAAVFIPIAILFIDRSVATFVAANMRSVRPYFDALTHIADPFVGLAVIAAMWVGARVLMDRPVGAISDVLLRCAIALCVVITLKDQLKYAFGRTWPETWTNNNPSFIDNGVYGFFPFHGGRGWMSFPSGHTATIFAVMTVLWMMWPRGRPLYALLCALVIIGLVGADYHWISDISAGSLLGLAVGVVSVRAGFRPVRDGA